MTKLDELCKGLIETGETGEMFSLSGEMPQVSLIGFTRRRYL